jgi:hypothetical protein
MVTILRSSDAYELVSSHGETDATARLVSFNLNGLILAANTFILDASRRNQLAPRMARCCHSVGVVTAIGANLVHGLGHGPTGALVAGARHSAILVSDQSTAALAAGARLLLRATPLATQVRRTGAWRRFVLFVFRWLAGRLCTGGLDDLIPDPI